MKKLLLTIVLCLGLAGIAQAEPLRLSEIADKLPPIKNGIAYSFQTHEFNHIVSAELASWKGLTFEVGGVADNKVVGIVSYPLLKLKDLGVTLPVLDAVEANLGVYFGWGRIDFSKEGNNEWESGISLSLLSLKF